MKGTKSTSSSLSEKLLKTRDGETFLLGAACVLTEHNTDISNTPFFCLSAHYTSWKFKALTQLCRLFWSPPPPNIPPLPNTKPEIFCRDQSWNLWSHKMMFGRKINTFWSCCCCCFSTLKLCVILLQISVSYFWVSDWFRHTKWKWVPVKFCAQSTHY